MSFYYGNSWEGISEWVDGVGWVDPYEDDEEDDDEFPELAEEEGDEAGAWGYHDKVKGEEAFFARYAGQQAAIRAIPYCQGYCYTQLTDVQQEINGLLTPDRRPKVDVERFAALTVNPEGRYC